MSLNLQNFNIATDTVIWKKKIENVYLLEYKT